jgi:hypothetical protein
MNPDTVIAPAGRVELAARPIRPKANPPRGKSARSTSRSAAGRSAEDGDVLSVLTIARLALTSPPSAAG